MLIHNKDDIEFVTEFTCFLGHPVYCSPNFPTGIPVFSFLSDRLLFFCTFVYSWFLSAYKFTDSLYLDAAVFTVHFFQLYLK